MKRATTAVLAILTVCSAVLLAGCDPAGSRVVMGRLVRVGGPPPGLPAPLPGRVRAVSSAGDEVTVVVGRDGWFKLRLTPGTYNVTGHSPQIQDGKMICAAAKPVHVTLDAPIASLRVVCSIM
jgi:hypothetical protein